jgi:hypothetical protein
MVVFTGWLFASSCSPPRLSATQLLSATKGQLPLRSGLSPNSWSALVGALATMSSWSRVLAGAGDSAATMHVFATMLFSRPGSHDIVAPLLKSEDTRRVLPRERDNELVI